MIEKYVTIIMTLILGLCIGSFLNVVIYRLPRSISLAKPASHCPKCGAPIRPLDNIPVLSYIFLRGKCRHCRDRISSRYPIIELANTALYFVSLCLFTPYIFPQSPHNMLLLCTTCLSFSIMICILMCDFDNMEIPDELQLALLVVAIVALLSAKCFTNSQS